MLTTLRTLVASLMSSLVLIAVAVYFVLGTQDGALDVTAVLALPLVAGVVAHAAIQAVGYRLPAIPAGLGREEAGSRSTAAYQTATILRFAIAEAVAIGSLAAAFVVESGGYALLLVGAVTSLVLLALHCWPAERPIARSQAALERDGGESYLREALGLPSGPGDVVRRT